MRKRSTRCFTLLLLIYVLVFTSIVTVPTTVSSTETDVIAALLELSDIISNLPDEAFENPSAAENHRNTLCNKIDAVINKVEAGAYSAAVSKLENDIKKTIVNWIVDPWETELLEQVDEIIRLIPPVHDIAVTGVTISPTEVYLGNQAYVGVTVANEGTESETFDVYVYVDQDTAHIGDEITLGPITTVLNVGATATLGFIWDTTGVAEGTHTISAKAVVALDDNLANNLFIDGTVTVLPNVGWIDGTVTDAETSDPLGGVTVEADGNFATTDTTGYYKIEMSPGDYTVTASMTGYITQSKPAHVDAGATTTVDFALGHVTHTLEVISDPILGIDFTVDGTTHTTPWSDSLSEGTHTIVMPSTSGIYDFDHWEDSSTNPTRTVSLTSDMTVTAYYVKRQWTLNVNSNPVSDVEFTLDGTTHTTPWSDLLDEGSYTVVMPSTWTVGTDVYNFDHWEDASTNPTRVVTLTADKTVTAYYVLAPKYWTLTVNSDPIDGVEFTLDGVTHTTPYSASLVEGSHTIIMPSTWDIYDFDHWEDASTDLTRAIDLTADKTIIAYYEYVAVTHKLTVDSDPITGIEFTINGATQITLWTGDRAEGSHTVVMPATWTTTASDVYNFDHWEDYSTDPTRTISLTADVTITAYYVLAHKNWTLTVDSEPITGIEFTIDSANHTTPWSDSLPEGTYTIVMPSNWTVGTDMYNFDQWEDGTTDPTRTISLTANATVMATYKLYVAPVASFTWSPLEPVVDEEVTFTSTSTDPDGTIDSWEWDFNGDGIIDGTTENATWTYDAAGTYNVTLTVTDNDSLTNSTSVDITVSPAPEPPVASFTYEPIDPFLNQTVTFNASASTSDGGDIVSYEWDFGDGTTGTSMNVTHAYVTYGNFTVMLNVTDNEGLWNATTDTVRVYPRSPIANFTFSPSTPYINETVMFNATESYDPDGDIVWYYWSFGDDTYLNATDQIAHHTYVDNGTYTVTLFVSDNEELNSTVSDIVTVPNRPPVAIFTESAENVLTDLAIHFDASDSYDPDGTILSYFWDFDDGNNATGVTVDHVYADDGVYTVTLTITDNDGETASKSAVKTVSNRPPIALFTENATTVLTSEIIHFDASGSNDPDGSVISYLWDFGDGSDATGATVNHAYEDDGSYTVTLTITDNDGETASKSAVKTVSNRPPIALFTENATIVDIDELIRFDASGSCDPDGTILSYFWDFDDGNNATMCVILDHAYTEDGNYTVTLTVTDDDGAPSSVSSTITVKVSPGWPLYLVAGIALGIAALTGTAIYAIFRRRKKRSANEVTAPENEPIVTLYVPRGLLSGYEKLIYTADNSIVLGRT